MENPKLTYSLIAVGVILALALLVLACCLYRRCNRGHTYEVAVVQLASNNQLDAAGKEFYV